MTTFNDISLSNLVQKINRRLGRKIMPAMVMEWQWDKQAGFGYYIRTLAAPEQQHRWGPYQHNQLIALGLYCGAIRRRPGPQPIFRLTSKGRIIETLTEALQYDLKFQFKTHVLQDAEYAIRNSKGPILAPETVELPNSDLPPIFPFEQHDPVTAPVTEIDLSQVPADELDDSTDGGV